MNTKDTMQKRILQHIQDKSVITPTAISAHFAISRQMVHRHLKNLVDAAKIKKIGSAPKVFYTPTSDSAGVSDYKISAKTKAIIKQEFFFIEPTGTIFSAVDGFEKWCQKRHFDISQKAREFAKISQKYQNQKSQGLLDASSKISKTFGKNCCVNQLFYFDFYAVEIFGKTKMGQKLLYAKQGQNLLKIKEIVAEIRPAIIKMISKYNIDSVVFVPPTVPRVLQFMKILETELSLNLPKIPVLKVSGDIRVAQKTLKKLADRIENAEHTFVVDSSAKFKTTLIIDDAVGSGASINQIACKLQSENSAKVIGFAITGSLNDFEIISEV
ncbi:MAG: winged helix-turn-helix transcriptional regulator [Candidatus Thioglobus sp.]|nr:MAG: winged helix-turn-helix transcriptional regulator [Candidatus Thioglobus sp.]